MPKRELTAKVIYWDDWDFSGQRQERFSDRPRPIPFQLTARVDNHTHVTVEINPAQARMILHSLQEYVSNGWRVSAPSPD